MNRYLLRVEAVNLSSFVYDTNDISTIRGGSLLLLDAISRLADLSVQLGLVPVSSTASVGMFTLDAEDDDGALTIRDKVEAIVRGTPPVPVQPAGPGSALPPQDALRHGTFVVDVVRMDGVRFGEAVARVEAENRWRQMCALSLAPPAKGSGAAGVCGRDGVRPASRPGPSPGERVSESVHHRREYGTRVGRAGFYRRHAGLEGDVHRFTNDLAELTTLGSFESDPAAGVVRTPSLAGKMAVIYADGNRFGRWRDEIATDLDGYRVFSASLQQMRSHLLANLVNAASADPGFRTATNALRMETLLWGGDEMLFAVPAWRGWWAVRFLCEQFADWSVPGRPDQRLTHALGVVFCHAKAPIARVRRLAEELAQLAKAALPQGGPDRTLLGVEVLESFDHVGGDLTAYRESRAIPGLAAASLLLDPASATNVQRLLQEIHGDVPRSRVLAIAEDLRLEDDSRRAAVERDILKLRSALTSNVAASLWKVRDGLSDGAAYDDVEHPGWTHLAELWDYLVA